MVCLFMVNKSIQSFFIFYYYYFFYSEIAPYLQKLERTELQTLFTMLMLLTVLKGNLNYLQNFHYLQY